MRTGRAFLPLIILLVMVAPALANHDTPEAWFFKGCEFDEKGQYDLAIQCYDKALALKPDYAEAWSRKGDALENLGHYEEAIQCYDKVLALKQNYVFAWNDKGVALSLLGKDKKAIQCFDKALAINLRFPRKYGHTVKQHLPAAQRLPDFCTPVMSAA